ncbi:MAG: FAD-dependent oxidoreductase [Gemmatimonadetes bacterium]|nr:FAD-dependent oxidoreductase [Gemmatimonadota bacterium]
MIRRDFAAAADKPHDLVIVGAGIHGITVALEAAARGLRPLVVDRGDFGAMASANTLRILHGGFRYLQSADLGRFFRSVDQRRWWFRTFPELVSPLSCLMPLYGDGVRRPSVLRAAILANDVLSASRNRGVLPEAHIPRGRVVPAAETVRLFPGCRTQGLRGGAMWSDGSMDVAPRLAIEMLRWLVASGGTALNYVAARRVRTSGGAVTGVTLQDMWTGQEHDVETALLVDATGACSGSLLGVSGEGTSRPRLALAFNVLIRRRLDSQSAVAVSAGPGRPIRFLRPWGDLTFAGTAHETWSGPPSSGGPPRPPDPQVDRFLDELNQGIPSLRASREDVVRVFSGLLPAGEDGVEPIHRPVVTDHGKKAGPRGLFSVLGEKYTTAPALARSVLDRIGSGSRHDGWDRLVRHRPEPRRWPLLSGPAPGRSVEDALSRHVDTLRDLVREESVQTAEDLLTRRLDWGLADVDLDEAAAAAARLGITPREGPPRETLPRPSEDG